MTDKTKWIFYFLITVAISLYIRFYPLRVHLWDQSHEQATLYVVYNIKKNFLEAIQQQAPQIPLPVAEQMATAKLNEFLRNNSTRVQDDIDLASQKIFEHSNEKQNIYLLESDTYYFYYLTQNIVDHGKMAETIKGSKYFDPLMTAPDGFWQPNTIHPYIGFWVYKTLKIFDPQISLMSAVAFTPLFIVVLFIAALFVLFYTLKLSAVSAFLGSLSFSLAPIILKRSALGWYRTDPYNMFFTVLLFLVIIKLATDYKSKKTPLLLLAFGVLITLFASIWQGWCLMLIMPFVIFGTIGLYYLIQKEWLKIKHLTYVSFGVLLATAIGVSLLFGIGDFFSLIKEAFLELQKFTVKKFGIWPNLFMEVGELKKSDAKDFISNSGGIIFLITSSLGVLYQGWKAFKKKEERFTVQFICLLSFLFVCILLTIAAERFSIFVMIPFSIFFAFAIEGAFTQIKLFKNQWGKYLLTIIIVGFLTINASKNIRLVQTAIFNSAWEKALIDIKAKTPSDSIINSWWPPGHFIKGIAHRKVMFDGATLSQSATGYWMANILLSENETTAANLLRMINSSGNKAVDFLVSKGLKTSQAVSFLTNIAAKSDSQAYNIVNSVLKDEHDVNSFMTLIRGENPSSYILLYNELVDQNLGLAFMGKWNIARVEALNANPAFLATVPARNSAAYLDFLWDLAGGQTHYSSPIGLINEDDLNYYFGENITINKNTMKATVNSTTYGNGNPYSVVYLNNGKIKETVSYGANLKYSIVLYREGNQTMLRLMDRALANSLLIKLFLFDAQGMEKFKLLTNSNDLTGKTTIKVFQRII